MFVEVHYHYFALFTDLLAHLDLNEALKPLWSCTFSNHSLKLSALLLEMIGYGRVDQVALEQVQGHFISPNMFLLEISIKPGLFSLSLCPHPSAQTKNITQRESHKQAASHAT